MVLTPFFISISLTCAAIHVHSTAKEEMLGICAAIVALMSFVASLIFAPWLIQALLLMFVAVFWRKLSL
jgi:hypothetical protein